MATVKVFWLPDAVTLSDCSLKTQIALLMLEFLWIYLNFCQRLINVTTGPLLFICVFFLVLALLELYIN